MHQMLSVTLGTQGGPARQLCSLTMALGGGGSHARGTLLGLLLSPFIMAKYGWPALFVLYGSLGLPLLALWQV